VDPFLLVCKICNLPTESFGATYGDKLQFSKCEHLMPYIHSTHLHYIIGTTINLKKYCILKYLLMRLFPTSTDITYDKNVILYKE